jgi:hypothetical protein
MGAVKPFDLLVCLVVVAAVVAGLILWSRRR